jgi:Zn-dependent protease with chaperone function
MDFFEAQDSARTRTRTLVVLFVAAVAAIIVTVYLLIHATVGPGPAGRLDPLLLAAVATGTILLVAGGSTARTMQLRQGGGRVAELLGGRLVQSNTIDEHERRLVNVVEEMAIASGTPVPAIYVLDDERGINAFAAGYTFDDAAVAVTRGTLENLTRTELQGVIAHEFSHILNGDMRLNIRLIGLLYGILLLAIIGRGMLYAGRGGRRGRSGGDGKVALIGIGLVAVGYIGVFFGRLIQAAVSRQREYLADAAAVQFTRAPEGIAGALKKIGEAAGGSRIENHHAAEASHLFFANGVSRGFTALMATHPPLTDRIRRIDPRSRGGSLTHVGQHRISPWARSHPWPAGPLCRHPVSGWRPPLPAKGWSRRSVHHAPSMSRTRTTFSNRCRRRSSPRRTIPRKRRHCFSRCSSQKAMMPGHSFP